MTTPTGPAVRPLTILVEPNPEGHRFQSVAMVTDVAATHGPVLLLTSAGARANPAFAEFLTGYDIEVAEAFDDWNPPAVAIAAAVAGVAQARPVARVLLLDADQALKRWWRDSRRELAGLGARRPRILFMLTRYPAHIAPTDWFGWSLRLSKGALSLVSLLTRSVDKVSGYAGRADLSRGWIVKRVRDPAICSAHSRDRGKFRAAFGMDPDRKLVGVFGVISERKYVPLVWDAVAASGTDAGLVLAGELKPEIETWLAGLPSDQRAKVFVRNGFLSDAEIDQAVAAVDVVALAMTNNGPSGIMGKALAAEVPVVTAGSRVRAEEAEATQGGESAEMEAQSFGAALARVLTGTTATGANPAPPTTPTEYATCLLDLGPASDGAPKPPPVGTLGNVHPGVRAVARKLVWTANTPLAKSRMNRAVQDLPRPIKLEIAGTDKRPGWLSTNVSAVARNYLDATARWPFEDGALSCVYADNMIEHIPLDAARRMLAEAHRCLQPGGVIRIVTPDLRSHIDLYLAGTSAVGGSAAGAYRDMGLVVEHPVDLVRIPIASFGHHVGYLYDFETLQAELSRAGFATTVRCELGESAHADLAGLDKRTDEGEVQIAVEATR